MSTQSITTTRPSLLGRARDGDANEFVRLYAPLTYAVARRQGVAEHDAEDLMQEAVLELLHRLRTFEYEPANGSFKGFVKKLVLDRVKDHWRRQKRAMAQLPNPLESDSGDDAPDVFEHEWQKAVLVAALDRVRDEVKPTTFQSFHLTVLCEWPIEEVAVTLALTPNTVSQNKRRVLQRLQQHIEEIEHEADWSTTR